jgi:hypothetical protein
MEFSSCGSGGFFCVSEMGFVYFTAGNGEGYSIYLTFGFLFLPLCHEMVCTAVHLLL